MFERRHEALLPRDAFARRVTKYVLFAMAIVLASLLLGILGYHLFEGLPWIDALVNAAMILGGMGPVDKLQTTGGKVFAAFYALYSGIVFLVAVGLLLVPIIHRFLHHFHLEESERQSKKS
jgi:hypothetical protein